MNTVFEIPLVKKQKGTVTTLCIVIMLFFAVAGCEKNDFKGDDLSLPAYESYYSELGVLETLAIRNDRVIMKTKPEADAKAFAALSIFSSAHDLGEGWVIASIDPKKTKLNGLKKMAEVDDATYGLEYTDGTMQYPTYRIFVQFKEKEDPAKILANAGFSESVVTIELLDKNNDIYIITLNVKLEKILQFCRDLYETGLCKFAEPSFFRIMKHPGTI
jgi:hypothetical protein